MPTLRATLEANKSVYAGVLTGFDALYPRSIETLIGPDFRRLTARLDEASRHRNKIFHGQLTGSNLSRPDLLSFVEDIRMWCAQLARAAVGEFGYDGFGRNSFKKCPVPDLWRQCKVEFKTVADYTRFIRNHMKG